MTNVQIDPAVDTTRRQWLQALAAAPLVASATAPKSAKAAIKTSARIVIAGSGLGGIAVANRLTQLLDGGKITIIDRKEEHNYQPGYTLVASGVWPVSKVRDRNADFLPAGIEWVKDMVAHFDPVTNTVVTASGQRIPYDFLVVATGVHLDYAQITGMDVSAIGREGLTSVYPSPEAAQATWAAMQTFTARGGNAVMTLPATPLKCAGAPLKMTFMLRDRLAKAGTLGASKIHFESALGNVFGVKVVNDNVLQRWQGLGIDVDFSRKLTAIDIGARRATFALSEGETKEMSYDFIHVVPPHASARRGEEQRAGLEGRPFCHRWLAGGGQEHAAAPPLSQRVRHRRHQWHAARQDRRHREEECPASGAQPGGGDRRAPGQREL